MRGGGGGGRPCWTIKHYWYLSSFVNVITAGSVQCNSTTTFRYWWTSPFSPFFANGQLITQKNGQTTNFCFHDEQTVNGLRKITWTSVFRLMSSCLHPCMSLCVFLHVSISPFLHVSISPCLLLHVSMSPSPCLHVFMYPCLHVSMSLSLHFHVSMFPEFCKRQMELTKNGNLRLFAGNGKKKRQTSICLL